MRTRNTARGSEESTNQAYLRYLQFRNDILLYTVKSFLLRANL